MADIPADFGTPTPPPPPRPIEYQDVDTRGWWVSILIGMALVAVGVWLLTNLYESVTVLAILVGVSLLVGGVSEIVALGGRDGLGIVAWIAGGLVIAAGIAVLAWPDVTLTAVAVLAGAALLVAGLLRVAAAMEHRKITDEWAFELGVGIVTFLLGAVVLFWPSATLMVLGFLLGIKAVFTGLFAIGMGWKMHQLAD